MNEAIYFYPLFGVSITIICYVVALLVHKRWKWMPPLFLTSVVIILFLLITKIPYEAYKLGGDIIVFFLGPATIALGVSLYKQLIHMKRYVGSIVLGVTIGSLAGLSSAGLCMWLFASPTELLLAMLPKSVTTPISIEIVRQLGGLPELGAVFTVLTGLFGSMFGPKLLHWSGIRHDIAIGSAMGTSAHGIGTARIMNESEFQGSVSSFSMGLAAIITSILVIPLYWWIQ